MQLLLLENLVFLIENPEFYMDVTPRQVLSYFAELKGYPKKHLKSRIEEIMAMVGLQDWIDKKIGTFSKGMRQKVGVIQAILHDPSIVVLDEPHTGLDPKARREIRDFILQLKTMGKTVFLSSHLLYEVSEVADRVAIISKGKIIACDTLENLESMAKHSIIQLELLDMSPERVNGKINELTRIIVPLTGLTEEENSISFNDESIKIEILFDGNPTNQLAILKELSSQGYDVIDFSVPKAGLLEDIYLNLIDSDDEVKA